MSLKLLTQFGVYPMLGSDVPDHKKLNLDTNKIYYVLRNGNFMKSLAESMKNKKIPVFNGNPHLNTPISYVENIHYNDGILLVDIDVKNDLELSINFEVETEIESGNYLGIDYDLVMSKPKAHSISLTEKSRKRIDFNF